MSNLALKNGRTSPGRITGNDSQRVPRGHSAVQRGPLRSNARLRAHCREESAPPTAGEAVFSRLGLSEGPEMLARWLAETEHHSEAEGLTESGFGALRKTYLEIMPI